MARPTIQAAAEVTSVFDTQSQSVPVVTRTARAPGKLHRVWALPLAAVGGLAIGAVLVGAIAPTKDYISKRDCVEVDAEGECTKRGSSEQVEYAITPASAEAVEPRLEIEGAENFDTDGEIFFVTITQPRLRLLDWFIVRKHPASQLLSYRDVFGDNTPQEQRQQGFQSMRTAKETAEFVALQKLGYPVELVLGDVIVEQLLCLEANDAQTECVKFSPADKVLDPGDKLLSVAGEPIATIDDLRPLLKGYKPGDVVTVEFEREGETLSGDVELIAAPDDPSRTLVGFGSADTSTIKLPDDISVKIDTDGIGGPSAGLAFTMTLIDELSPGDLLGGGRVAITGSIDINGNVGAIGGLTSKASAVQQVGVKYFLVPTDQGERNIAQARAVVGDDVEIIPVATVDEALAALERIGGDPFVAPNLQPSSA
jgi:PDZ domain-containing protein